MVGDDGQGNQVGMAPEAKWIACRNMDDGVGRPSTYIECLQFFIAPTDLTGNNPDPSKRPDVIDNSYSCPPSELCTNLSLHEAVLQVRAAGIFMSVSAGNSGSGCATINEPPGLEAGSVYRRRSGWHRQYGRFFQPRSGDPRYCYISETRSGRARGQRALKHVGWGIWVYVWDLNGCPACRRSGSLTLVSFSGP